MINCYEIEGRPVSAFGQWGTGLELHQDGGGGLGSGGGGPGPQGVPRYAALPAIYDSQFAKHAHKEDAAG